MAALAQAVQDPLWRGAGEERDREREKQGKKETREERKQGQIELWALVKREPWSWSNESRGKTMHVPVKETAKAPAVIQPGPSPVPPSRPQT